MKKYLQSLIDEALTSKKVKFSQQEVLADGSTRVIGYVDLFAAPEKGSTLSIERTNALGKKYFTNFLVERTAIVVYESGVTEGFIYLKYVGLLYV